MRESFQIAAMQVRSATLLRTIFALQGDFARGTTPSKKQFAFGIEVAPFKNNADAACCISADFELGWGWRSRGQQGAEVMGQSERRNFPLIMSLLDEYSIPITWATVGHLFLESCARSAAGIAHPAMPRPIATDGTWHGDWYACDPCSNVATSPSWYAPDLIHRILSSRVRHEVGTHSFSHINFPTRYSTAELVRRELEQCAAVMQPFGLKPRSLVFPRNLAEYAHLPVLAGAGVVVVRHRETRDNVRLSYPERTGSGVYKIYESMNLRIAKHYDYLQKVKIFVEKAIARHAVYSLWFHPSDPTEWFDPQLREIIQYLDLERRKGRLWIATMQELAAYCEAREHLQVAAHWNENLLSLTIRNAIDVSRYGNPEISLIMPIPSTPRSAWLELPCGDRMPAHFHPADGDCRRLIVTIPATTRTVQFAF
jgi:peptidoglycan/xylan/chitin deacetylase (PgdA/CDA1 family)